jgi:hypothetical protein
MFKVIRVNNESYIIVPDTGRPIHGDKVRIVLAMNAMGCAWNEIEDGLVSLEMNAHNIAHYGINKMFIFSAKLDNDKM